MAEENGDHPLPQEDLRTLTESQDAFLTRHLGAMSQDELKAKPVLARVLSSAPEYVDRYFEFKSMDSYARDEGSMAVGRTRTLPPVMKRRDSMVAEELGTVTWGLPLHTVFELALQYINEGAVKLPYGDRNQMFALKRQALKGPFTSDKMPALGWFDWVGHDIKKHWAALGDMDTHTAMATFCNVLQSNDSNWTEYLLEEKRKIDEGLRQEWEEIEERARREAQPSPVVIVQNMPELRMKEEWAELDRLARIADEEEKERIAEGEAKARAASPEINGGKLKSSSATWLPYNFDDWLSEVVQNADSSFVVPRGEELTLRVQTPGNVLTWWEFATERYDVGFSVSLEYSDAATGATMVVPILPLLRKECERRVVIGSHVSQHSGVYLLKFDNSYSYWRTKQVFFRVFATS